MVVKGHDYAHLLNVKLFHGLQVHVREGVDREATKREKEEEQQG